MRTDTRLLVRQLADDFVREEAPEYLAELERDFEDFHDEAEQRLAELHHEDLDGDWQLPFDASFGAGMLLGTVIGIAALLVREALAAGKRQRQRRINKLGQQLGRKTGSPEVVLVLCTRVLDLVARFEQMPAHLAPPPPPDLELQVQLDSAPGGAFLTYVLHSTTVGFHFEKIPGPMLKRDLETFTAPLLEQIERLHKGYDGDGGVLLSEEVEQELASLGRGLYRELFTAEMRNAYRRFRCVQTVQITSDEPVIPWELIKPYDDEQDPIIDDDFFCMRFQLTRWRTGRTPVSALPVRKLACVGSDELPHAALERGVLTALAARNPGVENASPRAARYKDVERLLKKGGCDLLHFVGHGNFSADQANESAIVLENRSWRARHLTGAIQTRLKKDRPLVFLNACRVGRQAWSLTGFGGWVQAWVRTCECGALLAPQWAVSDSHAFEFARIFYLALDRGWTLGKAARLARRWVRRKTRRSVTGLAYAVYGHPHARLSFGNSGASSTLEDPIHEMTSSQTKETSKARRFARLSPFMPERPPVDFVERPELVEPVVEALLHRDAASMIGLAAAFRGAGGYGKTTLARAVGHDRRIREAFPDGILWVTLGENPENLIGHVEDLLRTLSRERLGFSSLDAAAAALAALLEPLRALIIVDDVWSITHLRPFLRGGSRCARLITTRDRTVLPTVASIVSVDAMQHKEALRLLSGGLPLKQRSALKRLASRLGYWPLLLRLANGVLRDRCGQGQDLARALLGVGASLDRHGLTAFDVADPEDRNRAVASTLALSLDQLPPRAQEQFFDLAIFPEDAEVPFSVLEKLWDGLAAIDVETLGVRLHQLSLLQKADLTQRSIRLHDVIRAFLHRQRMPDLPALHRRFLTAGRRGLAGTWHNLPPEETYLWRHLAYHLEAAGLAAELASTVQDLAFLITRVALGDPHGAEGDLVRAERLTPDDGTLRLLHAAFANAKYLLIPCQDADEIASTFLNRLVGVPELREVVASAEESLGLPRLYARFPFPDSPDSALLRTLTPFYGQVEACSLSADGTQVATGCEDGSVTLWDVLLGAEVWKILEAQFTDRDEEYVSCSSYAALSADGSTVLAADAAGTVQVWDTATRVKLCRVDGQGQVSSAALSAKGHRGVCRWSSGRLCAFDTADGRIVLDAEVDVSPQGSSALSAAGELLLATRGKELCLWDLRLGGAPKTWLAHEDTSTGCALRGDGAWALSASKDGTARLWDTATGRELQRFAHGSMGPSCTLSAHAELAVTGGRGEAADLWNPREGRRLRSLEGHLGGVASCAINADGRLVALGGDLTVKLWRDPLLHRGYSPPFQANLRDGAIDAMGHLLAGAALDSTLRIWNLQTGEQIHSFQHPAAVSGCVLTPDQKLALTVDDSGGARIWDLKTGRRVDLVENGPPFVHCALNKEGILFAAAERSGRLRIWNLHEHRELRPRDGGPKVPTRCRFSVEGRRLLLASRDGKVRMWNLISEAKPQIVARHGDEINGCAITEDGQTIASACQDGTVRLWDLAGQPLRVFTEHGGPVRDCAFQPGGELLASVGVDVGVGSTLKVWDVGRGSFLASLRVDGALNTCGWLPSGNALFAAGQCGGYVINWQS